MNDFWFYGCEREGEPGHYLFDRFGGRRLDKDDRMGFPSHLLDGTFAPMVREWGTWRRVAIHRREPLTIIAGWDRTVDDRPGSNAAFVSHGVLTREEMLVRASQTFPAQYRRLFVDTVATWVTE